MKRFHSARPAIAACAICLFAISNFTGAPSQTNAASAQSTKGVPTQKNVDDERELIRLEEEGNELFMKREFAKLAENWADDVVFINLTGKIDENKAAALKGMQESKEQYDSLKNSEYRVRINGNVAVVSYLTTATGAVSFQARFTDLLEKRTGKWKLVHSHGTIVQGSLRLQSRQQN